jgi:hypothetical protein
MTLMGDPRKPSRSPSQLKAVLIHGGGVGTEGAEHYGVILRHPVWLGHFRNVFHEIRGNANRDPVKQTSIEAFEREYPHYNPDGGGDAG